MKKNYDHEHTDDYLNYHVKTYFFILQEILYRIIIPIVDSDTDFNLLDQKIILKYVC